MLQYRFFLSPYPMEEGSGALLSWMKTLMLAKNQKSVESGINFGIG
jgi:hypothetical protein